MKYQVERYRSCFRSLKQFHQSHWQEVEGFQDRIPLNVDHEHFIHLDETGHLFVMTARDEQKSLRGYALWEMGENPKHRGTLMGNNLSFYVEPSSRGRFIGMRLLKESESWMKQRGVKLTCLCAKTGHDDLARLAGLIDYLPAETVLQKWIGG
jgi:GNAT superfamily N-acetyltransferase